MMIKKTNAKKDEANIATGIDDDEELNAKATPEEVKQGDYTKVITLSYDDEKTNE